MADLTIWAYAHGGRFRPDPPAFHVIHSTEGPMSVGNAKALAQWFARSPSSGGPGTSATDIFDPVDGVRMLDEHTIPYHVGPAGNPLSTGSEHCGSVKLTTAQWLSDDGRAMLDHSAKHQAQRAHDRGWTLADCRWLSLTEVARRTVKGFCTHNDVRLALGGTTHSDPGPNFPYAWYMQRIRAWYQDPVNGGDDMALSDEDVDKVANAVVAKLGAGKGYATHTDIVTVLRGDTEPNSLAKLGATLGRIETAVDALAEPAPEPPPAST